MSDRSIGDAIARGIDRIVVPPESEWLPDRSRAAHGSVARILGAAAGITLILAIALAAGVGLRAARDRGQSASPPTPTEVPSGERLVVVPSPSASPRECASVAQAVLPPLFAGTLYPTRSASEVLAGLRSDPYFRHTLEDIAGVRQDPNPLRDSDVPRCAVDALTVGDPVFVRRYPSTAGMWHVPVLHQGRQLLIVRVVRDEAGLGAYSGSGGGSEPFPNMSGARAMQLAGTSSDPAISAELVFARAGWSPESVAWRVVRVSGSVYYVFPRFPGTGPDGLLLPESQVRVGSGS